MSIRPARFILVAALAALAVAGVWLALQSGPGSPAPSAKRAPATASGTSANPTRQQRLAALDASLRAIADGDSAAPRDRWDPAYVAGTLGNDPGRLFAWVRDSTSWIPYRGQLRGPIGVLQDRRGNSLDRAILLATLLETAGVPVRLARGELAREQALTLMTELLAYAGQGDAPAPAPAGAGRRDVRQLAAKYDLDGAAIEVALNAQERAASQLASELVARVLDQSDRLLKQVPAPDPQVDWVERFEQAVAALQDHWWVQRRQGDQWIDLDLMTPEEDTTAGALVTPHETLAMGGLPDSIHHVLAVRVVTERVNRGKLTEERILDHGLRPSELNGRPLVLQFWPARWPAQLHSDPESKYGLRGAALEQHEWGVALVVGSKAVAQAVLRDASGGQEPAGGGPLGGLGAGIVAGARTVAGDSPDGELTATWIEYEIRTPAEPPRTIRRAVFDLIGPAARDAGTPPVAQLTDRERLTRSLALMIRTEILPITAAMAPEYVTHLTAQAILANRQVLRSIAVSDSLSPPDADSLLAQTGPQVSVLYSLAAARFALSPVSDRIYVDRVGLLTRHRHPARAGTGFGIRGAVDVAAGDVGVALTEPNAFEVRLRQGVLDTNAEALWWQGAMALNAGEAYRTAHDWITLTPGHPEGARVLQLHADARSRIAQDLAAGFVVIAPPVPVASGREHFVGWWRIHPGTGTARGVAGNGWGQCQPEYLSLLDAAVLRFGGTTLFEWGLCHGLAQGINAIRAEAAARGFQIGVELLGKPKGVREVARGVNAECLIGAITSGLVSTLPILLKLRQLRKMQLLNARRIRFPLPKAPPPLGPKPPFVREAERVFVDAQRRRVAASDQWYKLSKAATADQQLVNQARKQYYDLMRKEVEAFENMQAARRQAGRLPPRPPSPDLPGPKPGCPPACGGNDNITQPDLQREFATELLQIGFGGVGRGL